MFGETRKKIVLSIMAVLLVFLAATLGVIYGSSCLSIKRQNTEMLDRYVAMFSLDSPPGGRMPEDPPGFSEGMEHPEGGVVFQLSSFYSIARSKDDNILSIDTGRNGIYQEKDIIALADMILDEGRPSGQLHHLMYRVDRRQGYTLVAFMDTTLTEDSMGKVLLNTVIAGAAAVAALFFAAVFLARRIIRPLEENDRKQKRFVSDAGHELKTPVSVISANAELLSRQIGDNEWLSNIRYENERMGSLVAQLLELSRAENAAFQPEQIDLSKLVVREVLPFESVAYEHGLSINSRVTENVRVRGNRHQLGQLISILTDNAIRHSTGGKTIELELKREHRNAVLVVANQGEEIPEEVRERLFDRFFRMDEAREEGGGHYGLGLSIAKAIVEAHEGNIHMEYENGRFIFSVSLPAEK